MLSPLVSELERRAGTAFLARTDATGIKVLERGNGENVQKGTFWAYVLDELDVVFCYTPTGEGATGPWAFLAGRTGYLQADAASVFDRVFRPRGRASRIRFRRVAIRGKFLTPRLPRGQPPPASCRSVHVSTTAR